jgi:aminotransferase
MKSDFSRILDTIPPSGIRKFFDLVIGAKDVISLGVGEPDFRTPWTIREDAIYSLEQGKTSYTSNSGLLECRQAIVEYLSRRFDLHYDAVSEILLTFGVSEAVDIVFRSILNPGDEVILPEPSYVCYTPLIQLAGGTVIPLDTSDTQFIPDPNAIARAITPRTKAIVLCSPSNPTGRVIPKDVLIQIGKLAKEHDFWIITDEVYAELTYDMDYPAIGALPGLKPSTILLNGFSKAFAMTGWRLGYICAPSELISRATKIHQYSALCAPITSQYAAIEAVKNCDRDVAEMRTSYQSRRNLFVKRLNEIGLPTTLPEGAFYCFPDIRAFGLSSEEFAIRLLREHKVAVVPGNVFGLGGEGYIRCCYATNLKDLKEALKRIRTFISTLQ